MLTESTAYSKITFNGRISWKVYVFLFLLIIGWIFYTYFLPHQPPQSAVNPKILLSSVESAPSQNFVQLITEPDDGTSQIHDAIATATRSIDLVIYELEDPAIEQDLVSAHNRGIAVRVILQNVDSFGHYPNDTAYQFLKENGVSVKWAEKYFALTHQKTFIIDGSYAIIMTFNLSDRYYATSRDFGVIDRDQKDIAAIVDAFNSDWKGTQETAQSGDDLVWSPGSADMLVLLINNASSSVEVYNEEMLDPRIIAALEGAAERGVAVRVNMTYATAWKSALQELSHDGVQVRTYPSTAGSFYIHAKMIVADNHIAFVGSENFSPQSLDYNRELGILISNKNIITSLEKTFAADWAGSRPFVKPET